MNPQEIRAEVERRADGAFPQVVHRLFDQAKREHVHHNGLRGIGCVCDYCCALHSYTKNKIMAERLTRMANNTLDIGATRELDKRSTSYFIIAAHLRNIKNHILQESTL